MYCENCGNLIENNARFCTYCGVKVDEDVNVRIEHDQRNKDRQVYIPNENTLKKKKLKWRFIVVVTIVIAMALAIFVGFGIYNKPENRLARALDLGQKYLLEENYEQAIVEFNRALEIDPKNEEAYLGLAEAYAEMDNLEEAVRVLRKGTERTDSEKLQEMLEKYTEKLTQAEALDTIAVREEKEESALLPDNIEVEIPLDTNDSSEMKDGMEKETEDTVEINKIGAEDGENPEKLYGTEEIPEPAEAVQEYTDEQLCNMARAYYINRSNYNPRYVEVDHVTGDIVTIHLYDVIFDTWDDGSVVSHSATCDWYEINRYTAKGTSFAGEEIDLTE